MPQVTWKYFVILPAGERENYIRSWQATEHGVEILSPSHFILKSRWQFLNSAAHLTTSPQLLLLGLSRLQRLFGSAELLLKLVHFFF